MSLLPFILSYENHPHRLLDQDFGLPMTTNDLLASTMNPLMSRDYYRPWRVITEQAHQQVGSTIKRDKNTFQINLDVQHFTPEEITVKTVDGYVMIEGKHEEKKDEHGLISRQFTRRYMLPEGCNPDLVESKLSSDGVLSIIAPTAASEPNNARTVPIAQTGPVRKEIKDQTSQAPPATTTTTTTTNANTNGAEK
ncbi:protein lethal(2)essential for life-like [Epargyreus clarus]|uniref:protein lethal(2)essential for life-like n=1 Tax=Epargyreus clarus TaxID=520877 RepID=UPI003C2B3FC0